MKRLFFTILSLTFIFNTYSQNFENNHSSDFILGNGLVIKTGDDYHLKLSGMIQSNFSIAIDSLQNTNYVFNPKHNFFSISGFSKPDRVSFLMLADFSLSSPLLDAWVAYHFNNNVRLSFGQKLISGNNRVMTYKINNLQFHERSLLSTNYSNSGREFGLFLDLNLSLKRFKINPSFGISSGDGRSSLSSNSLNFDFGGFKYFGRVDFYPIGYFSVGNNIQVSDIKRESQLKLVFGIAASYNNGVSNSVGEGHGDFLLYDSKGNILLPDYHQLYLDFLLKFRGFSALAEYVIASSSSSDQIYIDPIATLFQETQISEYLSIGTGLNFNIGYVLKNNLGFDISYTQVNPEFANNLNSVIKTNDELRFGFSRYLLKNDLKLSSTFSRIKDQNENISSLFAIIIQLKI